MRNIEIATAFYYRLGYELVTKHNIPRIYCGVNSGISDFVTKGLRYITGNDEPKDYNGYRDSYRQYLFLDVDFLYIVPGYEKHFFEKYQNKNCNPDDIKLIEIVSFAIEKNREGKGMLSFFVNNFPTKLNQILDLIPEEHRLALENDHYKHRRRWFT